VVSFTVGTGKLIPYDKLCITSQKACGLVVRDGEDFFLPGQPRTLKAGKKHSENHDKGEGKGTFVCMEQNCLKE
jgi:hypothetical protein